LIATGRPLNVSIALHATPIPPRPSACSTRYRGVRGVPDVISLVFAVRAHEQASRHAAAQHSRGEPAVHGRTK
jgi:hypothetical protein